MSGLVLQDVRSGYGATEVLRGVDLTVPSGQVVALLGPNGAGKTTLLRTCSGLLPPSSGRVLVDDHDVTHATPHELVDLGVCHVSEGRAVFPGLTVAENLRLMAGRHLSDETIDTAVEAFPILGQRLGQKAGTMSGGEQQMLALVRAYVTKPAYVLLDEVSMGLAPIIVDQIFEFLGRLASTGTALLLVEQYAAKALALADLVYVLRKGAIAFAGEPFELDVTALAESYLAAQA
jgi:branched-chain amino acid transport system ATP-binding protein